MTEPVVMVDVVEPNVGAVEKVDLQVESTPGVYTVGTFVLHIYIS